MKGIFSVIVALTTVAQVSLAPVAATADTNGLQSGSRLYLVLDEGASSARGGDDVGTLVRCRVWRDVEDQGVLFIKAGTPATCRVDKVSRRNMGGFEGKLSIGGVETRSTDGQTVMLAGGYNKEGSSHKALVLTVGILLLWPVLFVPGGNAELPPGTVFDVTTVNDLKVASATIANAPKVIDLRGMAGGLSADFMLDDFMNQPKHSVFRIKVAKDGELPPALVIDNVNGKPVEAIRLQVKDPSARDGATSAIAEVDAKLVAKHCAKDINRFEVAYTEGGERKATEVVMNVQM